MRKGFISLLAIMVALTILSWRTEGTQDSRALLWAVADS